MPVQFFEFKRINHLQGGISGPPCAGRLIRPGAYARFRSGFRHKSGKDQDNRENTTG